MEPHWDPQTSFIGLRFNLGFHEGAARLAELCGNLVSSSPSRRSSAVGLLKSDRKNTDESISGFPTLKTALWIWFSGHIQPGNPEKMSNGFQNANGCSQDREKLLRLGKMCRELGKEKDMLQVLLSREQSINAELIRRFESDATALSEAHSKDRKYIEELENKLKNCLQEIGFLQDQLNLRNVELNCLGEHVHSLELKLAEVNKLHENLRLLRDDALQSDSHCTFLMHELEQKESELSKSNLHIEKLEAIISSVSLESQCEIESMKLDMASLEQRCFEAERLCDQAAQEKDRMDALLQDCGSQFNAAQQTIRSLEIENKELQEKLRVSEDTTKMLVQKAQGYLNEWMNSNCRTAVRATCEHDRHLLMKMGEDLPFPNELCTSKEVLDPFLSKLAVVTVWDENVKDEMEKMLNQIQESECLISQLKEELREEKLRAKEEAEDLAQEMAELRYQITGMLEEECKRRACIEQASIRRIQELEAQVLRERRKSLTVIKQFHEARDQAEAGSREVHHLKNALKAFVHNTEAGISLSTESCSCGGCVFAR